MKAIAEQHSQPEGRNGEEQSDRRWRKRVVLDSQFVTLRAGSAISGVSSKTLRRAALSRRLPAFRPNGGSRGMILLKRSDLVNWIEASRI